MAVTGFVPTRNQGQLSTKAAWNTVMAGKMGKTAEPSLWSFKTGYFFGCDSSKKILF